MEAARGRAADRQGSEGRAEERALHPVAPGTFEAFTPSLVSRPGFQKDTGAGTGSLGRGREASREATWTGSGSRMHKRFLEAGRIRQKDPGE